MSKYKVEILDIAKYSSAMGSVDYKKLSQLSEELLNDYHEKGYHLFKIVESQDSMARPRPIFFFVLFDYIPEVDRILPQD